MARNSTNTENDCKTRSKRRRENPSNQNRHKSAKFKRKEKNTWPWNQSKKASNENELHGKIITDRLTVPQKKRMQSGLYLKGKVSGVCHRKNGVNLNILNEARINEKVYDIITLANKSNCSIQQNSLFCNEACNGPEVYAPEEHNYYYKYQPQDHQPRSFRENGTVHHKSSSFDDEDGLVMKPELDIVKKTSRLNDSIKNSRKLDDLSYEQYRAFIKFFDSAICLNFRPEEDFITKEKNSLKEKLRKSQHNNERNLIVDNSAQTRISLNSPLSEAKGDSDAIGRKVNCLQLTNSCSVKKTKKNPNYLPFKKQTKLIVQTNLGQKRHTTDQIDDNSPLRNSSQIPLPNSTASESSCVSPETTPLSSQLANIPPMKGTLLDPVNFLKNTLDSDNSPATNLSYEAEILDESVESSESPPFLEQHSPPKIFANVVEENSDQNYQYFNHDHQYSFDFFNERSKVKPIQGDMTTFSACQENCPTSGSLHFLEPAVMSVHERNRNFGIFCSENHLSPLNSSAEFSPLPQELYQQNLTSLHPAPCDFKENQLEGISAGPYNFWQRRKMF